MNVFKTIVLYQFSKRMAQFLYLSLCGMLLLAAHHVAAAPAAKANPQSSEDVLKWLQMTGTKSANEARDEKDQKDQKLARENKEAVQKATASAAPANSVATAGSPARPQTMDTGKTAVHTGPVDATVSNPTLPLMTVAAAPSSMLTIPSDARAAPVPTAVATPTPLPESTIQPDEPEVKVLSRPQPVFPTEAQDHGVSKGKVTARLYVGTDGSVTRVEIIEATPRRVFDRAVTSAAMRWKFSPIPAPNATDVTFNFKLEE